MHSIAIACPGEAFARDMLFTIASKPNLHSIGNNAINIRLLIKKN